MKTLISSFLLVVGLLISCNSSYTTEYILVTSKEGKCVNTNQQCYYIKTKNKEDWKVYDGQIDGFTLEDGYNYELKVQKSKVKSSNKNDTKVQYKLVKILSQSKNEQKGLSIYNNWIISNFGGESTFNSSIIKTSQITLVKGASRFNGNGGCNKISGKISISGDTINFSDIMSTRMICKNSKQENLFMTALQNATSYKIIGCELFLYAKDTTLLVLESCR
ncbi:hypothetical protein BTO06_01335 [Tenacibaculum sp. SZ-18]|uniref:META domain-containing protein n=1 Tax=Tenacibaculum sp. SZ-18 TaxID=754423 RepID=UPI000C2D32AF|nr:META domain-containing protein [Tenacibaculum sp. SZ-18]AUC13877.1 hypothetical protein BTO06_01335 [Tenacibaculum sp. SZ-18]